MQLVDIQHVSRSYGHFKALRDVTLSLDLGTVGLVGNNGAGKSTLLKILLGLLTPDSGGGTILGCDIRHSTRDLRGRIGYMPETAAVVPVLKGVEFVTLAGDLYGMPHRDARHRAHEVLTYVGLGELRYRRLEEYSAGNVQRLKLAAALVHDPQLLLLDEPTNGLDPAGRSGMLRLLEDLIAETGKSVILCTHLLGDVERLCDQIVVLHQGTVLRSGTMADLQQSIAGRFELQWQSDDKSGFAEALGQAGCELKLIAEGKALVNAPREWSTTRFFELARATGSTLTMVRPEEEDLARMFFRVTDQAHPGLNGGDTQVAPTPAIDGGGVSPMGIDNVRYHGWDGRLRTPWIACAAIVRVAMLQVFRRKSYWVVIALGMLNFLVFWSIIYAVTQFKIPREAQDRLLGAFGFSSEPAAGQENGYIMFMQRQSIIVMILLAFSGSLLVGSDFRFNSLPFYLSRRIDRRHYIVGKLLAVGAIVSLLTTVPALLLFFEYGMFTSSLDYWLDNWQIPVSVIAYGLVMSTVLSVLLVTLSAYLQKMAPIAITWSSLFVMLSTMSGQLSRRASDRNWHLLDPWRDIRYVGKLCFYAGKRLVGNITDAGPNGYYGIFANDADFHRSLWALLILVAVCTLAIIALVRRVRAVEIVN